MESSQNQTLLSDEISVKEILINIIKWYRYILSKWMVIVAVAVVGSIAGYLYAANKPLKYVAVGTFVLQETASNSGQGSDFASIMGFNLPDRNGIFQG